MSVQVIAWVLEESPVDVPGHRLVLLSLANHAHKDGTQAYHSVKSIASEARLERRAVQYALRDLAADLRIRSEGEHPELKTTIYTVLMDATAARAPYRGGANIAPGGAHEAAPKPSLTVEPSLTGEDDIEDKLFSPDGSTVRTAGAHPAAPPPASYDDRIAWAREHLPGESEAFVASAITNLAAGLEPITPERVLAHLHRQRRTVAQLSEEEQHARP